MTASATSVLRALQQAATPIEIATVTGLPVFRIRSSMRELVEAGLVVDDGGARYHLSDKGLARISPN
jgi:predicted transcriptional regulator